MGSDQWLSTLTRDLQFPEVTCTFIFLSFFCDNYIGGFEQRSIAWLSNLFHYEWGEPVKMRWLCTQVYTRVCALPPCQGAKLAADAKQCIAYVSFLFVALQAKLFCMYRNTHATMELDKKWRNTFESCLSFWNCLLQFQVIGCKLLVCHGRCY